MAGHDMGHMTFLHAVLDEDLQELQRKEQTYRGSWKRRGGVGAFMMLARKWDRMEGIVSKFRQEPAPAGTVAGIANKYDIFEHIAIDGTGDDGTMLAEVRDLRRYLALVEAEMISRGAVPVPKRSGISPATPALKQHTPEREYNKPDQLADELAAATSQRVPVIRHPVRDPITGMIELKSMPVRPGTPEDGGHHARDFEKEEREHARKKALAILEEQRMIEEEHVLLKKREWDGAEWIGANTANSNVEVLMTTDPRQKDIDGGPMIYAIVDRRSVNVLRPETLRVELNDKEHSLVPAWFRGLYDWHASELKWIMNPKYAKAWSR